MDNSIFEIDMITEGIYRISEYGMSNCYLIIGSSEALLIDTANGIGNLRNVVESITSLPLTVALTHMHPDHAGGAFHFKEIFVAKADNTCFFKLLLSRMIRAYLVTNSPAAEKGAKKSLICPYPRKTKWHNLEDGHIFDLGGKTIRTILTPGHTRGSAVFLDEQSGIIFTGDNVNTGLWLFLPGSASVEEWLVGAKVISNYAKELTAYGGHSEGLQTAEDIDELIAVGEQLVLQKDNTRMPKIITYPNQDNINIIYRSNNVKAKKGRTSK